MNKIKALLFLVKCFFYIAVRIVRSRHWNSISVYLEEEGDWRAMYRYMRNYNGYTLSGVRTDKSGNTEVIV